MGQHGAIYDSRFLVSVQTYVRVVTPNFFDYRGDSLLIPRPALEFSRLLFLNSYGYCGPSLKIIVSRLAKSNTLTRIVRSSILTHSWFLHRDLCKSLAIINASFILCRRKSYDIFKRSPRNILPSCIVQYRPTTTCLGQWTLARLDETKPCLQVLEALEKIPQVA
ncbi:hypothetical protein HAX54_020066 [Datura stramonium]|uniref:Uncharacterized protein n=1 Tax=Datura stramonium TaxID=4076 RepID=A0ABS8URK1_DATST|nr:hypothetical protein [Datura stramonium]